MIDDLYFLAKHNRWSVIVSIIEKREQKARRIAAYVHPHSGWTFLHQAAYHDNAWAAVVLLAHGAVLSNDIGKIATVDKLRVRRVFDLANRSTTKVMARSPSFTEATRRVLPADQCVLVPYAGGVVEIHGTKDYWTDSQGRVLVGWHGSHSPPCGMDGMSLV